MARLDPSFDFSDKKEATRTAAATRLELALGGPDVARSINGVGVRRWKRRFNAAASVCFAFLTVLNQSVNKGF